MTLTLDPRLTTVLETPPQKLPESISLAESLSVLEQHECWAPYQTMVEAHRTPEAWISLARVQNTQQDDPEAATESLKQLIKEHHTSAPELLTHLLSKITSPHDPSRQTLILEGLWDTFPETHDKVMCCEALANILEKQLKHSHSLETVYRRLLTLDQHNSKALLFFKVLFRQEEKWSDMAHACETLLKTSLHPTESQRIAQEYATALVYHLDQPQHALAILDQYCSSDLSDHSTLQFDAWKQLKNWDQCLNLLHQTMLDKTEAELSILLFRCAHICELKGQIDVAFSHYQQSLEKQPDFFEALEQWVHLALQYKNPTELKKILTHLENNIPSTHHDYTRIHKLKTRIETL